MSNELKAAFYSTLTGGTALTALLAGTTSVYDSIAPREASFDYVVFNQSGGGDNNRTPRRSKDELWTVKAVSATSARTAGNIDAQIDELLHGQTLTVTGWTNYWTMRERDIEYVETTPEGRNIWHVGGIYRVRLCE